MLIAILALFLSFSETLGKSAQTEAIDANVKSSDTWNFFQAKDIRKTTLLAAADQTKLLGAGLTDPAAKAAIDKQIDTWRKTAARYEIRSEDAAPDARNLPSRPRSRRKTAISRWRNTITMRSPRRAFQVGIVLASATVITGIVALAWIAGALGVIGLALLALGLFAPYAVALV